MITIAAGPDDLVSARMPALAERRALGGLSKTLFEEVEPGCGAE
jgi:hypothetical protein